MRISHTMIQKRIHEEKSKITDKELFGSPAYAAYLTDILEAATKRYKRKSKVCICWDESPDAAVAYTDNNIVMVNPANPITLSFPTRILRAKSLLGLIGHEGGHILFTDFTMFRLYQSSLASGKFYPETPSKLSSMHKTYLSEITEHLNNKDAAVSKAVSFVTHELLNILEDYYVESRMCDAFPGSFRYGIQLNNERMIEQMPSIQQEIDRNHHEIFIMLNLFIQYTLSGDVNNLTGYQGIYLDTLFECIPYIDDSVMEDDARTRFQAANHLLCILWPFMKSYIEKIREDQKNGTSLADADALSQLLSSMNSAPTGSTAPVKIKVKVKKPNKTGSTGTLGQPDSPSEETDVNSGSTDTAITLTGGQHSEENSVQDVSEQESCRIPLTLTEEISEESSGGITYNPEFAGSGYLHQAEKDMERILTSLATERTHEQYEQELSLELQRESDAIGYGNVHKGIPVNINRMSHVSNDYRSKYQAVVPPLLLISNRLAKQVEQALSDYKRGGRLDGLPMGKRISARTLYRNDCKIFYKNVLPNNDLDIAVAVLNDESGSMSARHRITHARAASIILHNFCRKLSIPITIYGHTEDYDDIVQLYSYAEFDSIDENDAFRLMDMSAREGNRDGAAIRFVAEHLLKRPEEIKLLFIISDGQPSGTGYGGTKAEADLRGIKKEYTNKGITIFAAAIGEDKPNIQRIYGDGYLDISDLNKLPTNLGKLIIQKIKAKIAA